MREEIVKVYQFEELTEEAKEVARSWWRRTLDEDFEPYTSMITDIFKEQLEELGYPAEDIGWSLSHCQGDGVAFYGLIDYQMMDILVKRFYENKQLTDEEYSLYNEVTEEDFTITANIVRNSFGHHYSHWNTMQVEIENDDIDLFVMDFYGLDYNDDEEEYNRRYNEIIKLIETIESLISSEIKEVSRKFEKEGYEEIDYRYSNDVIDETIIINKYEFTEDGKIFS